MTSKARTWRNNLTTLSIFPSWIRHAGWFLNVFRCSFFVGVKVKSNSCERAAPFDAFRHSNKTRRIYQKNGLWSPTHLIAHFTVLPTFQYSIIISRPWPTLCETIRRVAQTGFHLGGKGWRRLLQLAASQKNKKCHVHRSTLPCRRRRRCTSAQLATGKDLWQRKLHRLSDETPGRTRWVHDWPLAINQKQAWCYFINSDISVCTVIMASCLEK